MSAAVCLAAMMPASRAVCNGSPLATVPLRIRRSAWADMVISPRGAGLAGGLGLVAHVHHPGLSAASRCESVDGPPAGVP